MTRGRKTLLVAVIAIAGVVGWAAHSLFTLDIREAYAAWDTGTLLVEYMKQHDDRWPKSWDDLLTVLGPNDDHKIPLRGSRADMTDPEYARSLREKIAVDWAFDPAHPGARNPVTRPDGGAFRLVWEEPNEMVRSYLSDASTRPSAGH